MKTVPEKQKVEKWLALRGEENKTKQVYLNEINDLIDKIQRQEEFKEKLMLYTALGNETRYTIIKLLEQMPLCTCVLAEIFNLKESTISHHLKILEVAGLVFGLKKGSFISYHTKTSILNELK